MTERTKEIIAAIVVAIFIVFVSVVATVYVRSSKEKDYSVDLRIIEKDSFVCSMHLDIEEGEWKKDRTNYIIDEDINCDAILGVITWHLTQAHNINRLQKYLVGEKGVIDKKTGVEKGDLKSGKDNLD